MLPTTCPSRSTGGRGTWPLAGLPSAQPPAGPTSPCSCPGGGSLLKADTWDAASPHRGQHVRRRPTPRAGPPGTRAGTATPPPPVCRPHSPAERKKGKRDGTLNHLEKNTSVSTQRHVPPRRRHGRRLGLPGTLRPQPRLLTGEAAVGFGGGSPTGSQERQRPVRPAPLLCPLCGRSPSARGQEPQSEGSPGTRRSPGGKVCNGRPAFPLRGP